MGPAGSGDAELADVHLPWWGLAAGAAPGRLGGPHQRCRPERRRLRLPDLRRRRTVLAFGLGFRANKALGVGAVAVHALSSDTGNDQDFAYKFNIATTQPTLVRRYTIGKGDTGSAAGVGNSVRMDFQTIAILPDGRLAVSFLDSTTHYPSPTTGAEQTRPALAIEQTTTLAR
ncbi:MAG: hypothetical protein E6G02_11165 [Actinobacteria bacterium]|nr:MAG: hypothetical protein E6G02_11165 [Actinomycetota bacterium]